MDPYLEAAALWSDVHVTLICEVSRQLTPLLRPTHYAKINVRPVRPETPPVGLTADAIVVLDEPTEKFVEVRATGSGDLVTIIEIASPTNKRPGVNRDAFRQKRRATVDQGVNWLEIDLLRGGERPTQPGIFADAAYRIYSEPFEADDRRRCLAWPVGLRQPLPTIAVPLRPEHGRVPLELQRTLAATYDAAGYDLMIDYRRPPDPPLTEADAAWADGLLREAGLRRD
jgi:hypothetical protein